METFKNNNFDKILMNIIKNRRSVRIFNGNKISQKDIFSIIEAAIWAPTGCNNQELRYFILDKEKDINEIVKFKPFFKGVSTIILIFCDMDLPMSYKMYCQYKHERHLPYVDTGLTLANMSLYAKTKGIDSCIFNLSEYHFKPIKDTGFIQKIIRKIKLKLNLHRTIEGNFEFYLRKQLKMPKNLKIMCGIAFGYTLRYPDINKEMHGGKKVLREKINHYII